MEPFTNIFEASFDAGRAFGDSIFDFFRGEGTDENIDPGSNKSFLENIGESVGRGLGSVIGGAAETAGIGLGTGVQAVLQPLEVALLIAALAIFLVAGRVKIGG
jgi:hypothetical protein